jgi:hypothetical protein
MRKLSLLVLLAVVFLGLTVDVQAQLAQKEAYSQATGNIPSWFGTGNTERGAAVGNIGGNLTGLFVARKYDPKRIIIFQGDSVGVLGTDIPGYALNENFESITNSGDPLTGWAFDNAQTWNLAGYGHNSDKYAGWYEVKDTVHSVRSPLVTNPGTLTYWIAGFNDLTNTKVYVQYSKDGTTWTTKDSATSKGAGGDFGLTWVQKTVALNLDGDYYIRWITSSYVTGGFYIDDVTVNTGIFGGTFVLNDVGISEDGVIYACNLATNIATGPFKVYRWDSTSAAPKLVISYIGAITHRLGDKFTVYGKASDNTLTIWAAAASQDTVYKWTTADNGNTFSASVITLSDGGTATGTSPSVGPLPNGEFYVNGNGINPKHYGATGTFIASIPGTVVATGSNAIHYFEFGAKKYIWTFQYGAGNENARLVDVTAGDALATVVAISPSLGTNANANGTGDVDLVVNGTTDVFLVVMSTNNGFGAYTFPTYNVTHQVNMSIKMREGTFDPAGGDSVWIRGNFNNWGTSNPLSDLDADSIYTATIPTHPGSLAYKFYKTLRGGLDWESDPNRDATILEADTTLAALFFDRDTVYNPPTVNVPVTFQVNMKVKLKEGSFNPGAGDKVFVPGNFNGWSTSLDELTDGNADSIYTATVNIAEGYTVNYKYYKTLRAGSDWEGGGNYVYVVPTGGGTVPIRYFDMDSVVNVPITANILWQVNMAAYEQMGWFKRSQGDSVEVHGAFNGWAGGKMTRVPGTELYELQLPYSGFSFDLVAHKFYMDIVDSLTAVARFGTAYTDDADGVRYDHPAERGDGNRQFDVQNGGLLTAPDFYFSSINPGGLIKAGDSVRVTFTVDMTGALSEAVPFNPAADSVWMVWTDALSRGAQRMANALLMTNTSGNLYSLNLTLKGPAHYNLQYVYRYGNSGSTTEEGAGMGAQMGHRSRFITPLGFQSFPTTFNLPQESWQRNIPMPVEAPPLVTGVNDQKPTTPLTFALDQNYPNPFNPATTIRYSIPTASHVILKIYNMIGQEVTTLVDDTKPAGIHIATFEGTHLSTGVYFYSLQAGDFKDVKKMVLIK